MTAYATEAPAVQPAPVVFTEVLPAAAGERPAAIRWTPGDRPGAGELTIQAPTSRCGCAYRVAEYATGWDGRAVRMVKVTEGSDPEATDYDVYVGRNGQDRRCECRGFLRWGHCKHTASLLALLQNGWLDLHPSNPEADAGPTEPHDQEEPEQEAARVELAATVRELVGYPAVADPTPALTWLATPAAVSLLTAIGWETMTADRVVTLLTGWPF